MFIYKITNKINNKVYIGQSIRPIEQRFKRHINDAIRHKLDTHFARAIRKYGPDNFFIEQIDSASSQDELNEKEQYWIRFYDSINKGYNETDAIYKCGGNTYQSKSEDEMSNIKIKLKESKSDSNNPNAKRIKCLNENTHEELMFDTVKECQEYFLEQAHRFITTRVTKKTKSLYKGVWNIAYADEPYSCIKNVYKKGKEVLVENLITHIKQTFNSIRLASKECNINRNKIEYYLQNKKEFVIENYKFTILS